MNKSFACLLAVALLFSAPASAQQLQPVDRIVAVVDEDVILQSELDRAERNILAQYASRQEQLPPRDVLRRQVLERLVLTRLQVARAAEGGIHVSDEEVDGAIAALARQNHLTPDQMQAQLARDGLTLADIRSSIRDELVVQRLRQTFAQTRVSVSEAEVDAAMAAQAAGGPQYHLANLLIALPKDPTPEQISTGQQKVEGIKGLIDKGEIDFQAAAVRYSDAQNALEGGDLGWRSIDEIPSAFAGTIRTMQSGQVFGPVRGPSGFQLLKLLETRDASQAAPQMVTQYHARHILIRTGDNPAAAKAQIDTLAARLAGGADFAALARENSQDAGSSATGGELGWFAKDAFGPDFGTQVAALQDNQVSAPFQTQAGWHIVQRLGSRETNATDESRRAQLRESIGQRKLEDEWNRFLRELRGEAYVEFRTADGQPVAAPATQPSGG